MGWLFGRKKVQPKVPFPAGRQIEGTLNLPGKVGRELVIEPEQVKAAVGLDRPIVFPEEDIPFAPSPKKQTETATAISAFQMEGMNMRGPLFLKLDDYQHLLEELNGIKATIATLNPTISKYNEEEQFMKLRRAIKALHDRLLLIDKVLFKTGDRN